MRFKFKHLVDMILADCVATHLAYMEGVGSGQVRVQYFIRTSCLGQLTPFVLSTGKSTIHSDLSASDWVHVCQKLYKAYLRDPLSNTIPLTGR